MVRCALLLILGAGDGRNRASEGKGRGEAEARLANFVDAAGGEEAHALLPMYHQP